MRPFYRDFMGVLFPFENLGVFFPCGLFSVLGGLISVGLFSVGLFSVTPFFPGDVAEQPKLDKPSNVMGGVGWNVRGSWMFEALGVISALNEMNINILICL